MNLPRFFSAQLDGPIVELGGAEAHHLAKVRRIGVGEKVELFDGAGQVVEGMVREIGKGTVKIEVTERWKKTAGGLEVTVACALAKGSRWDWLLEKCTELGARRIRPVVFERSVVKGSGAGGQLEKWRKRCVEAAKQSGQAYFPELAEPADFGQLLAKDKGERLKLMGSLSQTAEPLLAAMEVVGSKAVVILVGPEGGLTVKEETLAEKNGYRPVFLGENTLRVETAAVGMLAAVRAWEDGAKIKKQNAKI